MLFSFEKKKKSLKSSYGKIKTDGRTIFATWLLEVVFGHVLLYPPIPSLASLRGLSVPWLDAPVVSMGMDGLCRRTAALAAGGSELMGRLQPRDALGGCCCPAHRSQAGRGHCLPLQDLLQEMRSLGDKCMFQWRAENKCLCSLLVINSVVRGGEQGLFIYPLFYSCNETAAGESRNAGKVCFAITVCLSSLAAHSGHILLAAPQVPRTC